MKTRELRMSADGQAAELWLYDEIDDWVGINANWVKSQLDEVGNASTIRVRLNSPGGMVHESVAIFNMLRQHPARVVVQVDGLAASSASVIAMAGDEIEMAEGSFMMVHGPWTCTRGGPEEHKSAAELLEKVGDSIAGIYARRTGKSSEHWLKMFAQDNWFGAAEAVSAGLADRVINAPAVAARAHLDRFKNVPDALRATRAQATTIPDAPALSDKENQDMKSVAKAMGLPESATEAEIVARVHENNKRHEVVADEREALMSAAGKESADAALGAVRAAFEAVQELAELKAKVEADAKAHEEQERDRLIAEGKTIGKITPAEADYWRSQSLASVRGYLEVASAKVPRGSVKPPAEDRGASQSSDADDDAKVYANMSGPERQTLMNGDVDRYSAMRAAWINAGRPAPDEKSAG